jgi:UDP-N-acetylmuramate dehydrogenase
MELRRAKGMLLEGPGAGLRSVGSFFVNPVVEADLAARIRDAVPADPCPAWTLGQGRVKLAAAWMIEKSGFPRGFRAGRVGLSPFHALALVNHGDAAASEVLALARSIQEAVLARFGVALEMEPTLVGF